MKGEQRVAVGVDSVGNQVVLFGVDAAYPMHNGDMCTGLIAAVPLEYITTFLSLEDEGPLMYYHIIRPDGSFVIKIPIRSCGIFEQLQKQFVSESYKPSAESSLEKFGAALKDNKYIASLKVNGEGTANLRHSSTLF